MGYHDYFTSGALAISQRADTSVFVTSALTGGTGNPVFVGNHDYHCSLFTGSLGTTGTLWVYKHFNSSGGGTTVHGSVLFGGGTLAVGFDLKSDTLGTFAAGTAFTHISCQVQLPAAGTGLGNLQIISYQPRTAGTTLAANGIGTLGTTYF
jgi:hypothetical protein